MYSNKLLHYGVKGMKWGIRKDNKQTRIRARSGRLNSFGKDGHNILYIAGISGSGKSSLAIDLANKLDAEPIHLDWYYDGRSKKKTPFSKFLKDNGVDLNNVYKDGKLNYKESDKIFPLLKKYSQDRKLIVEGVQLLDDTMAVGISNVLKDEPVLSIGTRVKISFNRASERDQTLNNYVNFVKAKKIQDIFNDKTSLDIIEVYVDSLLDSLKGGI